jgi:hypothetical protein
MTQGEFPGYVVVEKTLEAIPLLLSWNITVSIDHSNPSPVRLALLGHIPVTRVSRSGLRPRRVHRLHITSGSTALGGQLQMWDTTRTFPI